MNKEIELKFGIENMPNFDEYENIKVYEIVQDYLYKDEFSSIRKRKLLDLQQEECKYIYTVKTKGDIKNNNSVYEIETTISKEEYDCIQSKNNIVKKYRICIPITDKLIAEIDIYYGNLEGLITVEVEFKNEKDLSIFKKPIWFGDELNKKFFSNANLSNMSRDEFVNIMGVDNINKNMVLKNKIEKRLLYIKSVWLIEICWNGGLIMKKLKTGILLIILGKLIMFSLYIFL